MDIRLDGKVAIVTGGAGGIGLGCAEMLAASGAKVALIDCNPKTIPGAVKQVQKKNTAIGYQLEITDTPLIAPAVSRIRRELGEIDILVCCAGINIRQAAHEVTEENWDAIHKVNIKGLFFCNQAVAVQSMIPRRTGSIINIASQMGLVGGIKQAAYCASKGAIVQMTKAEAVDWAPYNIRINAVAPTYVLTDLVRKYFEADPEYESYAVTNILFHRLARVNDIAAAVCFLASNEANMITGTILPVDGGWTSQ